MHVARNTHLRRIAHANGVKKAPKRLARQQEPKAYARVYFERMRSGFLSYLRQLVDRVLIPELHKLADQAQASKVARADAATERLGQIIDEMRRQFAQRWTAEEFARVVRQPGADVERFNARQLNNQLRSVFGLDVVGNEAWLGSVLTEFVGENVALIKSIPSAFFNEIEKNVAAKLANGERYEELSQEIQDRFEVAASRANLIARDQIGKLNGDLNQVRQRDLGLTKYVWRTMNDERVRDGGPKGTGANHAEREGEVFEWSDPPGDPSDPADFGHPGEGIQCRCYAEAYLDDLLGGDDAG